MANEEGGKDWFRASKRNREFVEGYQGYEEG